MTWWHRRSIRFRLALSISFLATLLVLAGSVAVYTAMSGQLVEVVDAALEDRVIDVTEKLQRGELNLDAEERPIQILNSDGDVTAASGGIASETPLVSAEDAESLRSGDTVRASRHVDGFDSQVRLLMETVDGNGGRDIVVVGRRLDAVNSGREEILRILTFGAPIAALLIGGVGWLLVRLVLGPVRTLARQAASVDPLDATARIDKTAGSDEFSELATSFNALLERIEHAREHERRFIANVSHELRTPLAIIRLDLDLERLDAETGSASEQALTSAIEEVDHMTNLVSRLLYIARADAGQMTLSKLAVDVSAVVNQVVLGLPLDIVSGISVDTKAVTAEVIITDPEVLVQLVQNLVTNACRHAHKSVRIAAHHLDGELILEVGDDGDGFPDDLADTLFQPFAKGSTAHSAVADGRRFGLGLSIVSALCAASGGTVEAGRDGLLGGALVTIQLPVEGPSAASPTRD